MTAAIALPEATRVLRLPGSLELESGAVLAEVNVAYQSWGTLNAQGDNAVVICHALTGSAAADQWWGDLFGRGSAFDPERDFVLCANVLGSCYGSTGPLALPPGETRPFGPTFPAVTVRDMVRAQMRLLDHLRVRRVAMVIGGSLGGMQALEWALLDPERVASVVAISVSGRHSAWCIAISEAQRQAIYNDPLFLDGHYAPDRPPAQGLATARMMAMVSYRSRTAFEQRFGRALRDGERFEVESYLHHQGKKLVERFDANTYITLTRAMDSHDLARGRGEYEEVLGRLTQPTLVVACDSDVLYPPEEQEELAAFLPNVRFARLPSSNGHDAFLIDTAPLDEMVARFRRRVEAEQNFSYSETNR
ncbi:MAG: homoserine O-acetyltransferase [Thermoanaerobaculia bacterium]